MQLQPPPDDLFLRALLTLTSLIGPIFAAMIAARAGIRGAIAGQETAHKAALERERLQESRAVREMYRERLRSAYGLAIRTGVQIQVFVRYGESVRVHYRQVQAGRGPTVAAEYRPLERLQEVERKVHSCYEEALVELGLAPEEYVRDVTRLLDGLYALFSQHANAVYKQFTAEETGAATVDQGIIEGRRRLQDAIRNHLTVLDRVSRTSSPAPSANDRNSSAERPPQRPSWRFWER